MESAVLTPGRVRCAHTWWSLLCSQFQSIAQGWTQHLFRVVIPTKGSTKSQTQTQQGQDSPKNALLCPISSDKFHFLKFPKQQQQLETPYTPHEPVGMLHNPDSDVHSPDPKGSGPLITQNTSGLPPRALKVSTIPTLSKSPSVKYLLRLKVHS